MQDWDKMYEEYETLYNETVKKIDRLTEEIDAIEPHRMVKRMPLIEKRVYWQTIMSEVVTAMHNMRKYTTKYQIEEKPNYRKHYPISNKKE